MFTYPIYTPGGIPSTLKTSELVAWWPLEEASGDRDNATGDATHDLKLGADPGSEAAVVGNGATFAQHYKDANSGSAPVLHAGGGDWSVASWVKFTNFTNDPYGNLKCFMLHGDYGSSSIANYNWFIGPYNGALNSVYVGAVVSGTLEVVYFTGLGALSTGTWYHVYAQHEAATNKLGISVNNGTLEETTLSGEPNNRMWSGNGIRVGAQTSLYREFYGSLDELACWNRLLTASERKALYNNGLGITYTDIPDA